MRVLKDIVRQDLGHEELQKVLNVTGRKKKRLCLQHRILGHFDFSGMSLRKAELYNSVLTGCCFHQTDLREAMIGELSATGIDFRMAILVESDIVWSDLRHARFANGDLARVYFFNTNLIHASFRGTNLVGANFLHCDLSRADFTDACIDQAQFVGCTLDDVCGLHTTVRSNQPVMFSDRTW